MKTRSLAVAGLALLALPLAFADRAAAQSVDFKGKQIRMIIGFGPGGGYDQYARVLIRHMDRHIPGNPTFVAQNMPGAGTIVAANTIYVNSPKDGTVMGIIARDTPIQPLTGGTGAQFEATKFSWIGSANNEVSVCVSWAKTGIARYADLKTRGMIVGGTGEGADTDSFPKAMNRVLGTKMKLVTGYPGGNEIMLAMERGEVDGRCGYSWSSAVSTHGDWIRDKKMNVLVQIATQKHRDLPNVPLITELADNAEDKQVLEFVFSGQVWGRPFLAPPGVPADRVQALQDRFMAVTRDPAFIAEANKLKLEINPVPGPELARLIAVQHQRPPQVIKRAKEATN